MSICIRLVLFLTLLHPSMAYGQQPLRTSDAGIDWYSAQSIGIEGRAWDETESYFDRLPLRAKSIVREPVWNLSHDSAGMCLRFTTSSPQIHAIWELRNAELALPHMPATGVSGLDLYVRHNGVWRWVANGRPEKTRNEVQLIADLPPKEREWLLYLPLYNGVTELQIGVLEGHPIQTASLPTERKPIVFWGTSITQGACASRPGMAHTAILGRRLNYPIVNLGFSGNGHMEPEVARLVGEIDASLYVVDCLPNLFGDQVAERAQPMVKIIRQQSSAPILLVEDRTYPNTPIIESNREYHAANRAALKYAFDTLREEGVPALHYLTGEDLIGDDGEATVDNSHPTDLGFMRQANKFEPAIRKILGLN